MTKTLAIKSREETRNGVIGFEKIDDYSIMANYSKKEGGELQSMTVTVSYGIKQAILTQYGDGMNITYSFAPDITPEQNAEINDIFKQAVAIIKES